MARPVRAVGGSEWSVLALNPTGRAVPLAAVGVSAASWGCPVGRKVGNPTGRLGGAGQWWRGTAAEGGVWARARSAVTTAVNVAVSGAVGSRSTAPAMSGSAAGQAGSTGGSGRVGWSSTTAGNTTVGASWSIYHHRVGSIELVGAGDHVLAESA